MEQFPGTLKRELIQHSFTTKTGRQRTHGVWTVVLTDEQREWLCRWYPKTENARLMRASGMGHTTLHRYAHELNLTKSASGLRNIKRRQAARIKRLCERNGYYDSLRGRQPSEACRKAVSNMWQEVRDGKREHPLAALKHQNPRKYRQWCQRKSENRKEVIRKEKQRVVYGLERKTRLRFVMCKYTHSQTCHRYNALRRGYFVMEDCSEQGGERYNIYYDDSTRRSEVFERNLIADGFRLLYMKDET